MTTLAYLSPYLSEIHQFHGNSNFMNALTTTYVILFFSILSKISISSIIKLCNFSRMIKVCLTRIYRINPVVQTTFSIRSENKWSTFPNICPTVGNFGPFQKVQRTEMNITKSSEFQKTLPNRKLKKHIWNCQNPFIQMSTKVQMRLKNFRNSKKPLTIWVNLLDFTPMIKMIV